MARKPGRRNAISGQFAAIPRAMLECAARRALSLAGRRALDRLEIEHMAHGGCENGKLPTTYRDFEGWGIRPDSIASAIREVVALGFVEVTRRGYGGAAEMRTPSLYRLTYFPAWDAGKKDSSGTHEYLRIVTDAEADAVAKAARKGADVRNVERGKKQNATPQNVSISPLKTWGETQNPCPTKRGVQAHPTKRGALSISRDGSRSALPQSAVASEPAKADESAKIRAIETIMKSQECSYPEASELFENLPNAVPMSDQAN